MNDENATTVGDEGGSDCEILYGSLMKVVCVLFRTIGYMT